MAEETTLGFDLDATPVIATIDRLGKSSEAAAVSADKLAAAGERIGRSAESASARTAAQTAEILRLNAALNATDAAKSAAATARLAERQRELIATVERLAAASKTLELRGKETGASLVTQIAGARALAQELGILSRVETQLNGAMATLNTRAREAAAAIIAERAAVAASTVATVEATTAKRALGAATGVTASGLNGLRSSLTSMAASLLGAAPGVGAFTGALGTMAIGSGLMIGVMAGMAAIAFLWDKIGGAARKAKQEQDDAIESLRKAQRLADTGPAGQTKLDVNEGAKRIAELNAQIAAQRERAARFAPGSEGRTVADAILADLEKQYAERASVVRRGSQDVRRIEEQSLAESAAARLQFNQKDMAARRTALDQLAKDRTEYARLLTLPDTPENSAKIAKVASEIKQLDDALNPKAGRTARVSRVDTSDLDAITAALREQEEQAARTAAARAKVTADAIAGTTQDVAEAELLLAAIQRGTAAYEEQAREIEILHRLDASGISISDPRYEEERKRLENLYRLRDAIGDVQQTQRDADAEAKRGADEARREMERRARDLHRSLSNAIEGALTDISNRKNPLIALAEGFKRAMIHALAEALTTKIEGKVADILGIQLPADKITQGGTLINQGADKILRAAELLNGGGSNIVPSGGTPTVRDGSILSPAQQKYMQTFLKVGGAAYGGYQTGYGIGAATGDRGAGAIGGAASGFMLGNALLPGLGGIVGGAAGFVGGLLGASHAAAQAAAEMEAARKRFKTAIDAIVADLKNDELAGAIASAAGRFDEARQLFADQVEFNGSLREFIDDFMAGLKNINDLEAQYVAKLKEEAAAKSRYFTEDLDVRALRAQGQGKAADDLAFRNQQARELDEYRRTHDLTKPENAAQYAYLQQVQALEAAKHATDANTAAVNALTTTMRGQPSGFKTEDLNRLIQRYATPMPIPGMVPINPLPMPVNPFVPTPSPVSPPTLTRAGTAAPVSMTFAPGAIQINGTDLSAEEISKAFIRTLDGVRERAFGGSPTVTRAAALERMPKS